MPDLFDLCPRCNGPIFSWFATRCRWCGCPLVARALLAKETP